MSRIKICGLRREEDIAAVNAAKPDFAGFIVEVPKSRRSVTADRLRALTSLLDPQIPSVGVFVDAPADLVAELLEEGTISIAQLHGKEDEAYIRELRRKTEKPLIQAFSIRTEEHVHRACRSDADYILLDHGSGGTGTAFDWSLTASADRPFFLAGGLGAQNLADAIMRVRPWAVDLSSSVETDGKKDAEKIMEAVKLVRSMRTVSTNR